MARIVVSGACTLGKKLKSFVSNEAHCITIERTQTLEKHFSFLEQISFDLCSKTWFPNIGLTENTLYGSQFQNTFVRLQSFTIESHGCRRPTLRCLENSTPSFENQVFATTTRSVCMKETMGQTVLQRKWIKNRKKFFQAFSMFKRHTMRFFWDERFKFLTKSACSRDHDSSHVVLMQRL